MMNPYMAQAPAMGNYGQMNPQLMNLLNFMPPPSQGQGGPPQEFARFPPMGQGMPGGIPPSNPIPPIGITGGQDMGTFSTNPTMEPGGKDMGMFSTNPTMAPGGKGEMANPFMGPDGRQRLIQFLSGTGVPGAGGAERVGPTMPLPTMPGGIPPTQPGPGPVGNPVQQSFAPRPTGPLSTPASSAPVRVPTPAPATPMPASMPMATPSAGWGSGDQMLGDGAAGRRDRLVQAMLAQRR